MTVVPQGIETKGHGDARLTLRGRLKDRRSLCDVRQFRAQHADQLPIAVVDGDRTPCEGQHIGFRQHAVDQRIEVRRELADADHQFLLRRQERDGGEKKSKKENKDAHNHHLTWKGLRRDIIVT